MKLKLSIIVLITVMTSGLYNGAYAAAPKAGASCPKAGTKQVSKGIVYTCVKSGKKLVWNKGVVLIAAPKSSPSSSPSPNPSPSPTSSPTPTPSSTPSASPSPTQSPSPTPVPTPSPSATKEVSQNALVVQEVLDAVWAKGGKNVSRYTVTIEPARKDSLWAKQSMELVDATLDMVSRMGYPITTDFKIFFGWDWNWLQSNLPRNSWCYEGSWAGGGYCGSGINFINLKFLANWQRSGDAEIEWRSDIDKLAGISTLSHELIHQAQGEHLAKFNRTPSFYPAWIREGGPELLKAYAFAKTNGLTYLQARDYYLQRQYDKCRLVKLNELLMSDNHPDNCQGVLGFLGVEALIATTKDANSVFAFGTSKLADFGPNFDKERRGISNETYRTVMKDVFGIDIDTWHPLVEREFQKWAPAPQS
ncbi:MAG: hypothetical protein ACKOFJ_01225 [Actinomycetota bacterium]